MRSAAFAITLAACVVVCAPLRAAPASAELEARIDDLMRRQMAVTAVPGAALLVTRGDAVVYARGFGRDGDGQPFTPDTPAYIGSLSKSFTAAAVIQLVALGRLTLDTRVVDVVPEFALADPRGRLITVRHLLHQTSGLTDGGAPDWTMPWPRSAAEKVAALRTATLATDPGSQHAYHNTNYNIAARVVEVVSGEDFEDYVRRHILRPLGMTRSNAVKWMDEARDRVPRGHLFAYGQPITAGAPEFFLGGAGGVIASTRDLSRWVQLFVDRGRASDGTQVLPQELVQTMLTPEHDGPYVYQFGWLLKRPGTNLIRHNGGVPTFTAHAAFANDGALGVAFIANGSLGNAAWSEIGEDITDGIVALLDDKQPLVPGGRIGKRVDYVVSVVVLVCLAVAWRTCSRAGQWAERSRRSARRLWLGVLPSLVFIAVVMLGLPWLVSLVESWSWLWLFFVAPVVTSGLWILVLARALVVGYRARAFYVSPR